MQSLIQDAFTQIFEEFCFDKILATIKTSTAPHTSNQKDH